MKNKEAGGPRCSFKAATLLILNQKRTFRPITLLKIVSISGVEFAGYVVLKDRPVAVVFLFLEYLTMKTS